MSDIFCPATMCPLFAQDGSPWTGEKNARCPQHGDHDKGGCMWFGGFGGQRCNGADAAFGQVAEVKERGATFQLGPVHQRRAAASPRSYECPRAAECQWQVQASSQGLALCPPRQALAEGIDPRTCAY